MGQMGQAMDSGSFASRPLISVVKNDFPGTESILVTFAGEWECIARLPPAPQKRPNPLYVASRPLVLHDAVPVQTPTMDSSQFDGWRARSFAVFQPNALNDSAAALSYPFALLWQPPLERSPLQLIPVLQAQVWDDQTTAVVWHVYWGMINLRAFSPQLWHQTFAEAWRIIERALNVRRVFVAIDRTCPDPLRGMTSLLGYSADPRHAGWWRKRLDNPPAPMNNFAP